MPTDLKQTWAPPDAPLTPEERRLIAAQERLHLEYVPSLTCEDRAKRLDHLKRFEAGSPFVHPVPGRAGLPAESGKRPVPARPPSPAKKYFVHWGWMHRHTEEFTDFQRALGYFVDHKGGPCGARLVGEGYDADSDEDGFREVSDGLTCEERARLEAVS